MRQIYGTTYVLAVVKFDANNDAINKSETCSNRDESAFVSKDIVMDY